MVQSLTIFLNGLFLVSYSIWFVFTGAYQKNVIMEELLKDLREVCEKHGLTIENDSTTLYVNKTWVDMRQRVTKKELVFRCFSLAPSTEEEVKAAEKMWYLI